MGKSKRWRLSNEEQLVLEKLAFSEEPTEIGVLIKGW
jgi:hypothetical protein